MLFKDEFEFLSNFYPSTIHYRGTFWPTVEHAYQAAKCKDGEMDEFIRHIDSPREAKKIGKRVELRSDWEEIKIDVMIDLIYKKFTQSKELKKKLLATGDLELEEGNYWHDNFWGNCYCKKCNKIVGQNILGLILMEVRNELKKVGAVTHP